MKKLLAVYAVVDSFFLNYLFAPGVRWLQHKTGKTPLWMAKVFVRSLFLVGVVYSVPTHAPYPRVAPFSEWLLGYLMIAVMAGFFMEGVISVSSFETKKTRESTRKSRAISLLVCLFFCAWGVWLFCDKSSMYFLLGAYAIAAVVSWIFSSIKWSVQAEPEVKQ